MSLRILVVGAFSRYPSQYSYASSFIRSFCLLGYEVVSFNYREHAPFVTNIRLRYAVKKIKPDIIFILKGEALFASTIRWIKRYSKARVINFYPDNPFTFWNGNSNKEVLESLPWYDLFLIWSEELIPLLYAAGAQAVRYFPFGFDDSIFSQSLHKINSFYYDVCFVGSWEPSREVWLTALAKSGVASRIVVWGNGWGKCAGLAGVVQGAAVYYKELVHVLTSSKIVLNFIRAQNMNAHNMRTIEVPACGAFLLSQRTSEQAFRLFKEDESIGCFGSQEECIEKVNWYLHHENIREKVALLGNKRAQAYELTVLLKEAFSSLPGN